MESLISLLILLSEYVEKATCPLIAEILVFPRAISLLPVPVAPEPITIWFVALFALGSALYPINTLSLPSVITSPAWSPSPVFRLPIVFNFNAKYPNAVLLAPVVFPCKALYPTAVA